MVFTGSEPGDDYFPDAITICRFRNRPVTATVEQELLRRVKVQLGGRGLNIAGSRSTIIDAIFIERTARPKQHITVDCWGVVNVVDSPDVDALAALPVQYPLGQYRCSFDI